MTSLPDDVTRGLTRCYAHLLVFVLFLDASEGLDDLQVKQLPDERQRARLRRRLLVRACLHASYICKVAELNTSTNRNMISAE